MLPTRTIVNRSLNLLYPLECEKANNQPQDNSSKIKSKQNEAQETAKTDSNENTDRVTNYTEEQMITRRQSKRRAAEIARRVIYEQSMSDEEL